VNAVYGFLLVLFKAVQEFKPDYIAAAFDVHAPTFRHKKFKGYKAKRPAAPKELYQQIPLVKKILAGFGIPVYEKEGFEADDIIGTISCLAPNKQIFPKIETIIISGDLDTLQLIDEQTKLFALKGGVKETILYDKDRVIERYQGLKPEQLIDFKALRGDPSDNIPGVSGIGEKTALELIKNFGGLKELYQALENNEEPAGKIKTKVKELLLGQKEQAFFSRSLVEISRSVPIDFELEKCRWRRYNKEEATRALKELEFYSLIKRMPEEAGPKKENLTLL